LWIDVCSYILPWLFVPLVVLLPVAFWRRSRVLLIPATVSTALFCGIYGHLYLPRLPVELSPPAFTVMAYNVRSRNREVGQVVDVIETHDPDVIGLHELEPEMAHALQDRLAAQYPYREVQDDAWCGLFSRYPVVRCEFFWMRRDSSVPEWAQGYWGQKCVLDVDGEAVTVFNVHLRIPHLQGEYPFGPPFIVPVAFDMGNHEADLHDLLARVERVEGPLMVVGDLNLTDQQGSYRALATRLHDAHRESGWGMGFTYSSFPGIGPSQWRVDYVLHSSELVALNARVGDHGGSDHRPVIAQLGFRARGKTPVD
jgi:endonuclease/exonuclease/phosphatase (EEP) superfamily protein YafD